MAWRDNAASDDCDLDIYHPAPTHSTLKMINSIDIHERGSLGVYYCLFRDINLSWLYTSAIPGRAGADLDQHSRIRSAYPGGLS